MQDQQDQLGLLADQVPFRLTTPADVRIARDWLIDEGRSKDASLLARSAILFFAEHSLHAIRMRWVIARREPIVWLNRRASDDYHQQQGTLCKSLRRLGSSRRLATQLGHLEQAREAVNLMTDLRKQHTQDGTSNVGHFRLRFLGDMLDELILLTRSELAALQESDTWRKRQSRCVSTATVR